MRKRRRVTVYDIKNRALRRAALVAIVLGLGIFVAVLGLGAIVQGMYFGVRDTCSEIAEYVRDAWSDAVRAWRAA